MGKCTVLDRRNPWPHVANRHISISQLLSSCCYLITVSNSGLLSVQRPRPAIQPHFRHSHIPELICGVDSSIDNIHTLSPGGSSDVVAWIEYATKQRMAPSHSSSEKPPNSCLQNLTHSGIVLGGLSWFGPSRSSTSRARCAVRPWTRSTHRTHPTTGQMMTIFKQAQQFCIEILLSPLSV